jgi:hypothetical protein
MRSQEFDVSFKDFLNGLKELEEISAEIEQPSAVHETTKQQKQAVEVRDFWFSFKPYRATNNGGQF